MGAEATKRAGRKRRLSTSSHHDSSGDPPPLSSDSSGDPPPLSIAESVAHAGPQPTAGIDDDGDHDGPTVAAIDDDAGPPLSVSPVFAGADAAMDDNAGPPHEVIDAATAHYSGRPWPWRPTPAHLLEAGYSGRGLLSMGPVYFNYLNECIDKFNDYLRHLRTHRASQASQPSGTSQITAETLDLCMDCWTRPHLHEFFSPRGPVRVCEPCYQSFVNKHKQDSQTTKPRVCGS